MSRTSPPTSPAPAAPDPNRKPGAPGATPPSGHGLRPAQNVTVNPANAPLDVAPAAPRPAGAQPTKPVIPATPGIARPGVPGAMKAGISAPGAAGPAKP